jgi:hypothetical protein
MNFIHGADYDHNHEFPVGVLGELTPNDVTRFFKFKAFGINDDRVIDKSTDRSTGCWSSTLDMYKKVFHTSCQTIFLRGIDSTMQLIQPTL